MSGIPLTQSLSSKDIQIPYISYEQWLTNRCYLDLNGQMKHAPSCLCKREPNTTLDLEEKQWHYPRVSM